MFGLWVAIPCFVVIIIWLLFGPKQPLVTLAGKTVLITGGAGGLGRALSTEFSKRNCKVISCDLQFSQDKAPRIIYMTCDISKHDQIRKMISEITKEHGPIDVLINNAGIVNGGSLLDLSHQQIKQSFNVNILSHFWLIKEVLPSMVARNSGYIVAVGSVLGTTGMPLLSDYCATKAAVMELMTSLRRELQITKSNIGKNRHIIQKLGELLNNTFPRTTLVCPSKIATPMFATVQQPFLPVLEPQDVAVAIADAVVHQQPTLYLPHICNICFLTKLLPTRVEDAIFTFLGMTQTMNQFQKTSN